MNILQLCVFTNLWLGDHNVTSIDLKNGQDIFNISDDFPGHFDLVCAAPPCDQFTKANNHNWEVFPSDYVSIAYRCLELCKKTGKYWFLENPPGRIEQLMPDLTKYRVLTWRSYNCNKEYVLYSNFMIVQTITRRYGKMTIPREKRKREAWIPELIYDIQNSLNIL